MKTLKNKIFEIIQPDNSNNKLSKAFDYFIMSLILTNVIIIILGTFKGFSSTVLLYFSRIELIFIIIFTMEYTLRIWTADLLYKELSPIKARFKYIKSVMATIDLLSILPYYLPYIIPIDLRVLRLLRLFRLIRLLKLHRYTSALSNIVSVIKSKALQLFSSLLVVSILIVIASILMYSIESDVQPEVFENAFSGLWWAVSTLTTVGYGDIYPITIVGRILSAIISLLGIGLVAVPTGIISAGFIEQINYKKDETSNKKCFCPYCGEHLES